jgi:hypothetical protein
MSIKVMTRLGLSQEHMATGMATGKGYWESPPGLATGGHQGTAVTNHEG